MSKKRLSLEHLTWLRFRDFAAALLALTVGGCTSWDAQEGGADGDAEAGSAGSGGSHNGEGRAGSGRGGAPPAAGGNSRGGRAGSIGVDLPADFRITLEAEQASVAAGAMILPDPSASAGAYVDIRGTGTIDFDVNVAIPGYYDLVITASVGAGQGYKANAIFVNGTKTMTFATDDRSGEFYPHAGIWTELVEGNNTLSIRPDWGWVRVDRIELRAIRSSYREVAPALVNPNASLNARRLSQYLVDQYGISTLAGQQGLRFVGDVEAITGRAPAVLGLDLIDYSPSRVARGSVGTSVDEAIAWWQNRGGIVTFVWHWNAPSKLYDDTDREWWRGFYTEATYFDVEAALSDPSSDDYRYLLRDIDAIAIELQQLEDAGVPVLWRPLHEASGGWFWWGAKGPGPYLELWKLLYDRLTHHHQLDNLIWVWNGQAADWYPGDDYADIIGEDIYDGERNYSPQVGRFSQATQYPATPKLIALSENGALLDPDALLRSPASWSWFCVWSGQNYIVNEVWNEHSMKRAVYTHEFVTTLDELPDLTAYPLPE